MLATENKNIGFVSELPAVYLQTLSSGSKDSPPDISSTCFSLGLGLLVELSTTMCNYYQGYQTEEIRISAISAEV